MSELQEIFGGHIDIDFGFFGFDEHFEVSANNVISFKLQEGSIKEKGKNGCQVDDIIRAAKIIIESFNKKFPCRENSLAITKLDEALLWLGKRTADREARGVEGKNEA